MAQRKNRKILNMKPIWFVILAVALFLHLVTAENNHASETVRCEETAKKYSSVPPNLSKNVSTLCLNNNSIALNKADTVTLQTYINLTELYINNNAITVLLNYSFSNNSKLEILDVSSNLIKTVEQAAFAGLNKLRILYLQNNDIAHLDSNTFVLLKSLKVLNLQNNRLRYLDITISLDAITLIGNPWICSCGLFNLQKWFNNSHVKLENGTDTMCSSPDNLKNLTIKTVPISNCEKRDKTGVTIIPFISTNPSNNTLKSALNGTQAKSLDSGSDIQVHGKSWTFLLGVLVVSLSTSLLIVAAIKFPAWYRYLISYNHSRLEEDEPEMFEETFTPDMCTFQDTPVTNEEDSTVVFEQFHTFVPEDDGYIEDKYIDT